MLITALFVNLLFPHLYSLRPSSGMLALLRRRKECFLLGLAFFFVLAFLVAGAFGLPEDWECCVSFFFRG